jgi:dienelactone hydrolase
MKRGLRLGLGLFFLVIFFISLWQVRQPAASLQVVTASTDLPLTFIAPLGDTSSRPLVLIGHGFAGSQAFMRGFAYTLAKAGYVTAVWDFDGHGANPRSLASELGRNNLNANAEQALAEARRLRMGDPRRTAILGHSMGSGVALQFGQDHPETMATIAVSPTGIPVTAALPRNLLLMAGEREPAFLANARQRLEEAGGEGGDLQAGTGRRLVVIPEVEHISIVFSPQAHTEARQWLDETFGVQEGAQAYRDQRIVWYGIELVSALLACLLLVMGSAPSGPALPLWRRGLALAGGALGSTLLFWLLSLLGLDLSRFLGLSVGGFLLAWFAAAGLLALAGLNLGKSWGWLWSLEWKALLSGLLVAAALWLGVGLLSNELWLAWFLIPARLVLLPLGAVCLLPWFLAAGQAAGPASGWGRAGWWLAQTLIVVGAVLLALRLMPNLFFLVLVLPVFPLMLGIHALAAGRQRHAWAFGLSAALFIAWTLLAVFPLSA